MVARTAAIIGLVLLLRLPFLNQAIQGDDLFYLYGAQHAQIDPLHPTHVSYLFQGDLVSMQGQSHGPLDAWILAVLLALVGDVREVPFHLAYTLFSVIAALAMWSLARRFCERPFWATLLFLAVPTFVVNGNSLEADLPFLAFFLAAIALFIRAVDRDSPIALAGAGISAALSALAAYQAVFVVVLLGLYLLEHRRRWLAGWVVVFAAPAGIGSWQLFERSTSGQLPAAVLAGYMQSYGFQALGHKLPNTAALMVHSAWVVSPVLVLAAFLPGRRWKWIAAVLASLGAAAYDPNPLFWASIGCGVLLLASCIRWGFLEAWVSLFFAAALVVFFAGSARYLLPIAAPVAILVTRACSVRMLALGFALQMPVSLALAVVNYQHWDAYRQFAASLSKEVAQRRVWINGDWGLRFYLESEGALPMPKNQLLQPGEIVVTSELASLPVTAGLAQIAQIEIRPAIPLRIISIGGRSAYSLASPGQLLPFEVSTRPIDRVRAEVVIERKPGLSYLDPRNPEASSQMISGIYSDGWMTDQATVLLKRPEHSMPLRLDFYIPPAAPARHVRMLVEGQLAGEETFGGPGAYSIAMPMPAVPANVTVTVTVDRVFSAPGDQRKLGIVITGIGFR